MKAKKTSKTVISEGKKMSSKRTNHIFRLALSGMFLALALLLPFLTGQIPQIGGMLCPMHFPVLLCGFFCGPVYGAAVGLIAPLLRFLLFGMPPLMPTGIAMCAELAMYGLVSGLLYRVLPKKKLSLYISLLSAMLAGRIIWGAARVILMGLGRSDFGWKAFFAGAFTTALPGIALQIVLIPILVLACEKAFPSLRER